MCMFALVSRLLKLKLLWLASLLSTWLLLTAHYLNRLNLRKNPLSQTEKWPGSLSTFAKTLVSGDDVVTWNSLMNELFGTPLMKGVGGFWEYSFLLGVLFSMIFGGPEKMSKAGETSTANAPNQRRKMYQSFPNVGNLSQPGVFTLSPEGLRLGWEVINMTTFKAL